VVEALADGGLDKWRRGYFAGGDPGKYLPGHAMAKLLVDPDDPEPAKYMNDDRSFKEHYHFAAVNWARFYPLFGERVLTERTREQFAERQRRYNYLRGSGTENHKTMWWTSANVLPWYTGAGTNNQSKERTLREAKTILRDYVHGLYHAGQGEWDSSTYLMFDVNGLLNIHDFSEDEEARLLARAGLDYLVSAYALKYTDGVFCAPNQRGYAKGPHESIADQTGYVWWGSNADPTHGEMRDWRYTIHPITSRWKPNAVITRIARKDLPTFPVEQNNSKANYWHGQGIAPRPGATHETVYLLPHLTMGSLWDGHASQHTRFMIVAETDDGGAVFSGGHPRKSDHTGKKIGTGFHDGIGRYVQSAQVGPTYLCMAETPEGEQPAYTFLLVPDDVEPRRVGPWFVFEVGQSSIAVRGLNREGELTRGEPDRKGNSVRMVRFDGRRSGFVVLVGDRANDAAINDFQLDADRFAADMAVNWTTPDGREVSMQFNPDPDGDRHGDRAADVTIDGEAARLSEWDIYGGPYVHQTPGVLTVNDGREGFIIDFTGDLPVYKSWSDQ